MREGEADFSQREVDATLALLIDTQTWIQRRTDRVILIDTYTIRRSITFEIELPEWTDHAITETDCRLILPIGVFGGGQALRNLEVKFGQEPAGTLTRHAGDRLTALLRERLQKNGDLGIPESTRYFLDELLQLDTNDATMAGRGGYKKGNYVLYVTSDKKISEASDAGSRFVITINTDQTLVRSLGADAQPTSIKRALRAIGLGRVTIADREARIAVTEAGIAPSQKLMPREIVDGKELREGDRVMVQGQIEEADNGLWSVGQPPRKEDIPNVGLRVRVQEGSREGKGYFIGADGNITELRDGVWLGFRRFFAKVRSVLFPSDHAFVLAQTFSGFGDARSWQLEIYAPDELRISDGTLIWWPDDRTVNGAQSTPGSDYESSVPAPGNTGGQALPTRRATSMVALTRFRVQADSIIHIGQLVTWATIILLVVAIGIALDGTAGPIVDAVVAILVIAPSLGASIVTNPENHEMAGDFLKPIRQRIYFVGFLAALAAALFILFGLTNGTAGCAQEAKLPLSEVPLETFLNECQQDKASFWQDSPGDALASWSGWGRFFLTAMILTLVALLYTAFSFFKINRDQSLRNQRSVTILARGERTEKDLRPEVFLETTSDERNKRGIFGRWRSIRNSRRVERDNPLETLATDAIDLGPRAIFRAPPRSKDMTAIAGDDPRRVKEGTLEGVTREQRKKASKEIPGLFDRFFYGTWIQDRPPEWFFWSSDIEADYIQEDVSEGQTGDGRAGDTGGPGASRPRKEAGA